MHAPVLERSLESLLLTDLHAHPDNVRGPITGESVESLAESIRARGVLVPLTVRPNPLARPGYQVLAGHRRMAAAKAAGLLSVPCQVLSLGDDEARAVVLLENQEREDPNLFSQCDLVAKLLAARKGSVGDVAAILGKSRHWVASMRAIAGLEPSVRKAMDSERCSWTVPMVEYFAGLAHDVQKSRWADVRHANDLGRLKEQMGEDFHKLKDAPFDILADDVLPKAGSCAACPKTSARAPGLFEAEDLDPANPDALKKATCRDPICWQAKSLVALRARAQEVAAKTGVQPVMLRESFYTRDVEAVKKATGMEVLAPYEVSRAKKGEKGAVPALTPDSTTIQWVKPPRSASEVPGKAAKAKPKDAAKAKPPSDRERLARLDARRKAWVVDTVADQVGEAKDPPYELVRALASAFGSQATSRWYGEHGVKAGALPALLDKLASDEVWASRTWGRMRSHAEQSLRRQSLDTVDGQYEDAVAVHALLTSVTRDEARARLQRQAEEAVPLPKSLQAAAEEKPAAPAPKRRARSAQGKAAAAGDEE